MSAPYDPRLTPARPDLAAAHLRGKIEAPRYAEGVAMQVIDVSAPVRNAPAPDAALDTEALHGERVTIYDIDAEGWAWGQLDRDGYVGWLPRNALSETPGQVTHRVGALRTLVFAAPDIKTPPICSLSFGSMVEVSREDGMFAVTVAGGFIPRRHLAAPDFREAEPVAVAQRFLGTPYYWGGKTSLGLDCSGLVQLALQACGVEAPRDSDMQRALGTAVAFDSGLTNLARGDLVFWKGHVGFCAGEGQFVHANAHHMAVAEEPLAAAVARIRNAGLEVMAVRRPIPARR